MRLLFSILFLLCICSPSVEQTVSTIHVQGSINPATASYIRRSINQAAKSDAECIIIHLNTPGGLLSSTRQIVCDIMTAAIPVVVYVSPSGAHAASAGLFVTISAHVAVMAPGTN